MVKNTFWPIYTRTSLIKPIFHLFQNLETQIMQFGRYFTDLSIFKKSKMMLFKTMILSTNLRCEGSFLFRPQYYQGVRDYSCFDNITPSYEA